MSILSVQLLFLTDVLDELVFLLLLAHVVLVQTQPALFGTGGDDLGEDAAAKHAEATKDCYEPWSVSDVAGLVGNGCCDEVLLGSVAI